MEGIKDALMQLGGKSTLVWATATVLSRIPEHHLRNMHQGSIKLLPYYRENRHMHGKIAITCFWKSINMRLRLIFFKKEWCMSYYNHGLLVFRQESIDIYGQVPEELFVCLNLINNDLKNKSK